MLARPLKAARTSPHAATRSSATRRSVVALLAAKRDGRELAAADIRWLIANFVRGEVADYQMSAFAMAVVLRGMTPAETLALTLAMRDSGKRLWLPRGRPVVDKHSTGGVGDKVSLCLAPLMAACGLRVPMIAGRGLGHTGGTIDKLESIPGLRVELALRRFARLVDAHGFAISAQTAELAPADRRLYALRDVTATVESVPLITASILSKKLAEGLDALVLDVKVGRGAFMKTPGQALALSRSLIRMGKAAGLPVRALLTRMDSPLGTCVGNALEAAEAFSVLTGAGPDDLIECTFALGAQMLSAARLVNRPSEARACMLDAIRSGRAVRAMEQAIAAQGGDARVVREPDRLPRAPSQLSLRAPRAGYVRDVDALAVALCALRLGAGRTRVGQSIDPAVGIVLRKKPGDRVKAGDLLADVHARSAEAGRAELRALGAAFRVGRSPVVVPPLVLARMR